MTGKAVDEMLMSMLKRLASLPGVSAERRVLLLLFLLLDNADCGKLKPPHWGVHCSVMKHLS